MSLESDTQQLLRDIVPAGLCILRIDSQEMLIEWDSHKMPSFDFSTDSWGNAVRNIPYIITGIIKWDDDLYRIHFVRGTKK